ncbi:MAG: hypothetical protein APF77_18040 [Clostridia bacterium BRH_c25]|nr:MAG: hypothetical protein APF77_18040 [Clostridia bacterium BRH_c25]
MFLFMFLGVEIFVSMGLASSVYLIASGNAPLNLVSTSMVNGISGYSLLAIPFFMLVGELMNVSGMTQRVIRLTQFFVGSFKGGLAYAAIFVNMLLASISGSAPADCSAVSSVLIPEMKKEGYPEDFSAAVNCCAAVLGPIIPPSIPMVFLAMLSNLSTGRLLLGGVVPGIMLTAALVIVTAVELRKQDIKVVKTKKSFAEFKVLFRDALLALIAPIIILLGVITGFVTITEVAILASAYILVIGVFFYKTITLKKLIEAFKKATSFASSLMVLFGVVGIFSWFIAVEEIPAVLLDLIHRTNLSPEVFLLAMNILLLIVGMLMDAIPAITILMPVLMPVATSMGIDPIHFGVIVVVNLMIGLITPPVGALLYVETKISGVPFGKLTHAVRNYIIAFIVVIFIVTYVPSLVTAIPNMLMGG